MKGQLRILVTGSAGFIGHHVMMALRNSGHTVVGLDLLSNYYDPKLKLERLKVQGFDASQVVYNELITNANELSHSFIKLDLADENNLRELFVAHAFNIVVHLGAQAGVRHSIDHPQSYVSSNLVGFANILECCRQFSIKHLLFASSSSVYGLNSSIPFKTTDKTGFPVSFYAATKKANEAMAHSYAHLYNIPVTGMRFFTVYGPLGRPDMAYYSFTEAISNGKPISLFNSGNMLRDFTYVDDVVQSILKLLTIYPKGGDTDGSTAPYKLYNIGKNHPEKLLEMVVILERLLNKKAKVKLLPMQAGDVVKTYADITDLMAKTNFKPSTTLAEGLARFVAWYKVYNDQQQAILIEK